MDIITNPLDAMRAAHFSATGRDLYVDVPLSNVALGYRPKKGIADLIMPVVEVPNQSGSLIEFFRADTLRVERSRRAPGTEANFVTRSVGSKQFFCKNYALKTGVTVEDLANADAVRKAVIFDRAAEFVADKLWIGWEQRLAALAVTTNVMSYKGVSSAWNTSGNPLLAINTAIDNIKNRTGVNPNRILFGEDAWKALRRHADIRNLINGVNNGGGYVAEEAVAKVFEVDKVLVSRAVVNTANETQAEALSKVMTGDNVLVYYVPDRPSIDEPSWAYSYRWTVPGVPAFQAERHPYDSKKKRYEVEVGYYQGEFVTGTDYAFLLQAVNSSQGASGIA